MATALEPLPEVEQLRPGCIRILGGNPGKFTLQGSNTYLLGRGSSRILIDAGEGKPTWIGAVKRVLDEEKATIASALITHWHHDHVGGIHQLLGLSPSTKVYKHTPSDGQLDIKDEQVFSVKGATLHAAHTPGHTADHVVFVWKEEDALFTGDSVLGHGTAVFEDLGSYMASLAKMRQLFGGRAYPGHGPVIADGPAKVAEYIEHRRQREEQVIQALRSRSREPESEESAGAWTSMELVKVIYADVPESLHPAAEGSVQQVLQKLEKEGKVSQQDHRWTLKDTSAL